MTDCFSQPDAKADEKVKWTCKARPTADPPQDCEWPHCGCDPYANKVLDALEEQAPGLFSIELDNRELRSKVEALERELARRTEEK